MKVRFILPNEFDITVDLPQVPDLGETVGIPEPGTSSARLVEVESRRWFIATAPHVVEVWLTDSARARTLNAYVHHGCRYGYERYWAEQAR